MHKAPGRENVKLKAMKRLPSWNQKLEESCQAKEMEYGSAGNIEGCVNNHIRFKTAQLLFEVVYDGEGGRTRAMCFDCMEKLGTALGNGTSPSTLRFMQAQQSISKWKNITLEVECGADRFAGELLYERYRKALDKRAALGLSLARALASAWQAG